MWSKGQVVTLPNGNSGVIQEVSKREEVNGLVRGRDKCKVRYEDGNGGQAEQWFAFDVLNRSKVVEVIVPDKEEEMIKVSEIKDREKLDWIAEPTILKADEISETPVDTTNFVG